MNNIQKEAVEKLINSVEWNTITIDKDVYQEMQEELESLREEVKEPDWSESETSPESLWKNTKYSVSERLQYADSLIHLKNVLIDNLTSRIEELTQ